MQVRSLGGALRERLEQAVADGEIADQGDAADAQEALTKAEMELTQPQPNGRRVVRSLETASEIFTQSAEAVGKMGQVGAQILKLAPIAAALWQIAQKVFGG